MVLKPLKAPKMLNHGVQAWAGKIMFLLEASMTSSTRCGAFMFSVGLPSIVRSPYRVSRSLIWMAFSMLGVRMTW